MPTYLHKIIEEGQQNKREVWLDVAKLVHKTEQVREREREREKERSGLYRLSYRNINACLFVKNKIFIYFKKRFPNNKPMFTFH